MDVTEVVTEAVPEYANQYANTLSVAHFIRWLRKHRPELAELDEAHLFTEANEQLLRFAMAD